jgi:hypothetical protein
LKKDFKNHFVCVKQHAKAAYFIEEDSSVGGDEDGS